LRHIAEVALTLAHEINNPLAVIMGELQLQLEDPEQPVERAALEICLASSQRIAEVVRKILALQEVAYQEYGGVRMLDLDPRGWEVGVGRWDADSPLSNSHPSASNP
jgi:signal transduction histidine kinase